MIYTVTFNLSIGYIMFIDGFELKRLNRARETYKLAGREDISVSRVLKTLDVSSIALGSTRGFPRRFVSSILKRNDISTEFIKVSEDIRINAKLESGDETGTNTSGPNVTSKRSGVLLNQIRHTSREGTVVVAGSVPKSIPSDAYAQIIRTTQETGAKLVADAGRGLVSAVLEYRPLFVRPNKDESEEMSNVTIRSDQDVVKYGREIVKGGAQSVITSLGGGSAICVGETGDIKAQNPKSEVVNIIGSGDSTVVSIVTGLELRLSLKEAFCQTVASGTVTVFNDDLALRKDIEKIKSRVTISVLDGEQQS